MTRTLNELKQEARSRYPPGTRFIGVVEGDIHFGTVQETEPGGMCDNNIGLWPGCTRGYVYDLALNKWAEIVGHENNENTYPIY